MTYEVLVNNVCDANETHIEAPFERCEVELIGFTMNFGGLLLDSEAMAKYRKFNRIIFNPEYGFPESSCVCDCCSKKR